jgi:diguanylate cyclase (GGDEF)-like protein/PAS domain S-box-containing protein
VAGLLGISIAAVLQTYVWEGGTERLSRLWQTVGELDAMDTQLRDAEELADDLVRSYSPERAARCRTALTNARRTAGTLQAADAAGVSSWIAEELDSIGRGLASGSAAGMSDELAAYRRGGRGDRIHQAIRQTGDRQRGLIRDGLDKARLTLRLARVALEAISALRFLLIGVIVWQLSKGSKSRDAAERALAVKEEQYRQAVEMAGDIICRTDRMGRFTYCNPTALSMLRLTGDEVLGRSWLKLVRQDKREAAKRFYLRQLGRRTRNTYYEFPVIDGHGRERWLAQNVQLLTENGEPAAFQAIAREITERKRAEYELDRTRAFVERIAATTPGILYVYDLEEQRNIFSNREIVAVLGYKPEDSGDADPFLRFHPDDAALMKRHYDALRGAQESEIRRIEYRVRHAAGHWVWLSSCDTPFERNAAGLVKRIVGIAQDITARKATEEKLARQADYDALTGLASRAHFFALLQRVVRRAAIEQSPVSFCMLDFDRFHEINERYGNAAGDEVLRAAGSVLLEELRRQDVAGRLGGDELGFILPQTELTEGTRLAARVCARIAELEFGEAGFRVTATFGVSEWHPHEGTNGLTEAAERALYRAKAEGHSAGFVTV